jgi:hypothetical protein
MEVWIEPPLPWSAMLPLFVLTTAAAWVQGSIGLGFAIVTVPVLLLIDPRLAPAPQILVVLPLTALMAIREWSAIEWRGVVWVLVGRLPGLAAGVGLLRWASRSVLDLLIGAIVLGGVVLLTRRTAIPRNRWTEFGAGAMSGLGAVVSSIGGPPVALLYRDARGSTIRATLAGIFFVGVLMTIASRGLAGALTGLDVQLAGWSLPFLLLGFRLSRLTLRAFSGHTLKRAVLGISATAALLLWGRALWSFG